MRVHGWVAASSVIVGMAVLPSAALAASTPGTASQALGTLKHSEQSYTKLNAQIALLKKKLQIAQLQAKIHGAKQNQSGAPHAQSPRRPPQGMPPGLYQEMMHQRRARPHQQQHQKPAPLPEIVSVEGMGARLTAVLRLHSGNDLPVQVGSSLPHGAVVHAITANGVTVKQGGKIKSLSLASASNSAGRGSSNNGRTRPNGGRPDSERGTPPVPPPSLSGESAAGRGMSPPPGPGDSNAP